MQQHEGPPHRPRPDEAQRQRALTRNLLITIGVLVGAIGILLVKQGLV